MSAVSNSPKSTVHPDDDRDMLDSLRGLSIKGFQDCAEPNANTPSSTNASLPTPPALKSSHVFLAPPDRPFTGHNWFPEERSIPPPNAPLMKDLDSFTEGTGPGSFDFPLATGGDESPTLPFFFHPSDGYGPNTVPTPLPNSLALDLLPSTDPTDAVLAWIEGISATSEAPLPECPSTPKKQRKRRRSFTQGDDDEAQERPRRAWSPTIDSAFIPNREHREEEPLEDADSRAEPEAPG